LESLVKKAIVLLALSLSLFSEMTTEKKCGLALALHDTQQMALVLKKLKEEAPHSPATIHLFLEYFIETANFSAIHYMREEARKENVSISKETLEKLAWKILERAAIASHPRIRAEAAWSAASTYDARGMAILAMLLDDPNEEIQLAALQLAHGYPDHTIQKKAKRLLKMGSPAIKIAATELLIHQQPSKISQHISPLLHDPTLPENAQIYLASLIASLTDQLDITWIQKSIEDPHPAIRSLASTALLSHPDPTLLPLLFPLLSDPSANVREVTIKTLGTWQQLLSREKQEKFQYILTSILEKDPVIYAATAGWALLLSPNHNAQEQAAQWFLHILQTEKPASHLACARLIHTGKAGVEIAFQAMQETKDPIIKINLASFLLMHRLYCEKARCALREGLADYSSILGEHNELFSWIGPSTLPHSPMIPRLPESEDLRLRLQLIALTYYAQQPIDKTTVEKMLYDQAWGIPAAAALFLFQEFASDIEEVLSPMLAHEIETVRLQAALLLAISCPSTKNASMLYEEYKKASKQGKEILLLGFATLPIEQAQEVLTPLLCDSSEILRTRAAGAFLYALYQ